MQFADFDDKAIKGILEPPLNDDDIPESQKRRVLAYEIWIEGQYGKVFGERRRETNGRAIPVEAARDFMKALRDGHVPDWVADLAPLRQLKELGGKR
jgi:hypothetical protein